MERYTGWIFFRGWYSKLVMLLFLLLLLHPYYLNPIQDYYSKTFLTPKVKVLSERLWQSSQSEEDYIKNVLQWQNQSMQNVYGRRGLFSVDNFHVKLFPPTFCLRIADEPSWLYFSKCGACGEYALFFREIVKYSPVAVRSIHNPGDDHTWAEVYVNDTWIVVDPSVIRYDLNRSNYAGRSYIYAEYPNGSREDITHKYRDTGTIEIVNSFTKEPIEVIIVRNSVRKNQPIGANCTLIYGERCGFSLGNTTFDIIAMNDGIIKKVFRESVNITVNRKTVIGIKSLKFNIYFTLNTINPAVFRILLSIAAWWLVGVLIALELAFFKQPKKI